jgi:hypothetical protein
LPKPKLPLPLKEHPLPVLPLPPALPPLPQKRNSRLGIQPLFQYLKTPLTLPLKIAGRGRCFLLQFPAAQILRPCLLRLPH